MNPSVDHRPDSAARDTVLAIDDSPETLDVIRESLRGEFQTLATTDGQTGLDVAARKLPDLILLDIMMPGMDGYEVCKRLKSNPQTHDIPVVFFSALGSEGDEVKGFAAGAVDFVTKPIEPIILRTRVRTQLELSDTRKALADANNRLARERELLAEIILGMRTDEDFCHDRLSYASRSQDTAGGDIVLSALRPNGDRHVLLGDFTGHGLPAAIGTPLVSHLFYQMTANDHPLGEILAEINNVLLKRLPVNVFMAAAAICFGHSASSADIWNFGSPDGLHRDAKGVWSAHRATEVPMGIVYRADRFEAARIELTPGDRLYLMSDGPIEATGANGELFGADAVMRSLEHNGQSVGQVLRDVFAFAAIPSELDDMTLLRIDGPRGAE